MALLWAFAAASLGTATVIATLVLFDTAERISVRRAYRRDGLSQPASLTGRVYGGGR